MKKVIAWLLTFVLTLSFAIIVIGLHLFHVLFSLFGYKAYMIISHGMMWAVWRSSWLIGNTTKIEGVEHIGSYPRERPLIIVSNHQSEYEIACLGYLFSKTSHHLKYVAKKELSYWIPSVSWNIRYGGHGIIDRRKRDQALVAIEKFAQKIQENKWSAYIYPEGTRNKSSNAVRSFKTSGFTKLCECMPDALVIPISIENFWTVKSIPVVPLSKMRIRIFDALEQKDFTNSEILLKHCENLIRQDLEKPQEQPAQLIN
ncbi:hypothetical protein AD998_16545 [bacterium 336/3]|nr:hypothetical protein AD998_16545 [bacterium 336/3]